MRAVTERFRGEGRGIALLLGASLMVVGAFFVQALSTLRSHRIMVETTLSDFTAFGAERVATALDRWFEAIILDRIAVASTAHYRWLADPTLSVEPGTARPLPPGTVSSYFSLTDTGVVGHGVGLDGATRAWIGEQVRGHLPGYPPPAPYVVLRSEEPDAIVYRREITYGQESVYGFILHLDAPVERYRRIVERTALVPRSLVDEASSRELFGVAIHLSPDAPPLFRRALPHQHDGPEAWAFAPKAGRLAVSVQLDGDRAEALLAGNGAGVSLPLLAFLAFLAAGLLWAAITLLRRSHRLSALRESFIANVSHDLRTPITQIRMFSETLRRGHFPEAAERERALQIIERQTEVIEDLVDNLLHASGRGAVIDPVPTDVVGLMNDVVDGLAPSAAKRGTGLVVTSRDHDDATLDPVAATRILTNLVDNAIRHGREGGRVEVAVANGDGVTFVVDDDGPGIPPAARERVFQRFEQLPGTHAEAAGTGIGLSVVRSLAQRHGGEATVEESPLGGARVIVRLGTPSGAADAVDDG